MVHLRVQTNVRASSLKSLLFRPDEDYIYIAIEALWFYIIFKAREVEENSDKYLTVRQMLMCDSFLTPFFQKEQLKYEMPYFINNEWLFEIFRQR